MEYSDIKKVIINTKKYLGHTNIYFANNPNKKFMVFNPDTEKFVEFGANGYTDFTKHNDKARRDRYLKRATNIRGNWKDNKYSPNNLSINILWK